MTSWSTWQAWSGCSTSCGGGIQTRNRTCGKPDMPNVIANCYGNNIVYRNCSTWKCPGKLRFQLSRAFKNGCPLKSNSKALHVRMSPNVWKAIIKIYFNLVLSNYILWSLAITCFFAFFSRLLKAVSDRSFKQCLRCMCLHQRYSDWNGKEWRRHAFE